MVLKNHIAYRFLTDDSLAHEIMEMMHPTAYKTLLKDPDLLDETESAKLRGLWNLVNKEKQKTYLVTESVHDKLDLLKVKRNAEDHYDWTVFKDLSSCKKTFILNPTKDWDGGGCLRFVIDNEMIQFCHLGYRFKKGSKDDGTALWTIFFIDRFTNRHAEHCEHQNVKDIYEFVYKLFCFVFLSENEEEIIKVGEKKGTKKSGKIINTLPIPLTIINSKWNITSIRTEGFDVSGHFRLQPTNSGTKMIFIQPFQKHGYVRKAKNLEA